MDDIDQQIGVEDVLLHLAHSADLYPGGLSQDYIDSAYHSSMEVVAEVQKIQSLSSGVLFVIGVESAPNENDSELLKSIIEKGMQRSEDSVAVRAVSHGDIIDKSDLASVTICFGELAAVACGISDSSVQGNWHDIDSCSLLHTFGLDQIRLKKDVKRKFWQQLQEAMGRING